MGFHRNQVLDDIHVVNARVYADITARDADVPFQVVENVNKVVRVDAPVSFFLLTSVGPSVWQELTNTLTDSFLELIDTPSSYVGKTLQVVQVTAAEDGLEFGLRIDQIDEFVELTDTPSSYVGKALQVVRVDLGEAALEFSTAGMGDVSGPGVSVDEALARFDGTTGRILQNSVVIVDDVGVLSGMTQINIPDAVKTFIEGVNEAELGIRVHDLTLTNWTQRGEFSVIPDAPQFAHDHGDGAGNITESQHLLLNDLVMEVLDTINLKGLEYAADYSANFDIRSLVDKAFVDAADAPRVVGPGTAVDNALARFDGVTGKLIQNSVVIVDDVGVVSGVIRFDVADGISLSIEGENGAGFLVEMFDLTPTTFLSRGEITAFSTGVELTFDQGDGTGATIASQNVLLNGGGMLVTDSINSKGLEYGADYSANFVARSIVDKAYVDAGDAPPANVLFVRSIADLPAPVGIDIIIPDNTVLFIETVVDLGSLRIRLGVNCVILGFSNTQSVLTSDDPGQTLDLNATTGRHILSDVKIENTGVGVAIGIIGGALNLIIDRVAVVGDLSVGTFGILSLTSIQLTGSLRFTADTPAGIVIIDESLLFVGLDSDGIVVPNGVTLGTFNIDASTIFLTTPTSRGIVLADPDSITSGIVEEVSVVGAGTELLAVDPGRGTDVGIAFEPFGMTVFEGNLYATEIATDTITKFVGISNVVDTVIAAPSNITTDIVFVGNNLVSGQSSPARVNIHAGFTTTITNFFTLPGGQVPTGITFDGVNLIVKGTSPGDIFVIDGISGNVLETLDGGANFTNGLHFDGANLWVGQFDKIQIRQGVSDIVQYEMSVAIITGAAGASVVGMAQTTPGGPLILADRVVDDIVFTDHPVTFDQSSPSWKMHLVTGVLDSADNGCVCFRFLPGQLITITAVDVWADITDGGVNIFYTLLPGAEKFIINDSANGEMTYIGGVSKAFRMGALLLAQGDGGTDSIEIGVSVNGRDPTLDASCTMANGIITNTARATLTSPGASVRLIPGDKIKLQVRNRTDSNNINTFQVLLSATG